MSHWLDEAAKGLAQRTHTRRDVLRRGTAAAVGATLGPLAAPPSPRAQGVTCGRIPLKPKEACCIYPNPAENHPCRRDERCCGATGARDLCCEPSKQCCVGPNPRVAFCYDRGQKKCCINDEGNAFLCSKRETCCGSMFNGTLVKGGKCCPPDQKCCMDSVGSYCYSPAREKCCVFRRPGKDTRTVVCDRDEECCGAGQCCKNRQICCRNPEDIFRSVCCDTKKGETCCNGVCCPKGRRCINGQCAANGCAWPTFRCADPALACCYQGPAGPGVTGVCYDPSKQGCCGDGTVMCNAPQQRPFPINAGTAGPCVCCPANGWNCGTLCCTQGTGACCSRNGQLVCC